VFIHAIASGDEKLLHTLLGELTSSLNVCAPVVILVALAVFSLRALK
jgi:hypothetical protein